MQDVVTPESANRMRVLVFCVEPNESRYADMIARQSGGRLDTVVCGPVIGPPLFAWKQGSAYVPGPLGRIIVFLQAKLNEAGMFFLRRQDEYPYRLVLALAVVLYSLPARLFLYSRRLRRYRRGALAMITAVKPDAIVLFEDNIENLTRSVGAAADEVNVPYVVVPTTIPNPLEPARFYGRSRLHSATGPIARLVAKRWPQWVYNFEGRSILRLPVAKIVAIHLAGTDVQTPWVLNSGSAKAICVESEALASIYRELGVDDDQIVVTGSPIDAALHRGFVERAQRRRMLLTELGMDPDRILVVVGFPPDQYTAASPAFEYRSFDRLLDGWQRALAAIARKVNVVIRPHPRLNPKRLEAFVATGCKVVMLPTEDLVPMADIYVASISATIRWALALGIPVVNYDCYRYRYDDYRRATGMVLVEDQPAFADALRDLVSDNAFREQMIARQKADMARWGCIDGLFYERFEAVLKRFTDKVVEPARLPAARTA